MRKKLDFHLIFFVKGYYNTIQHYKIYIANSWTEQILKLSQYIAILLQIVMYSHNDIFLHFETPWGSDFTTLFSSEFPLHYENIMKWCNTGDNRMQNIAHYKTKIQNHKETQYAMSWVTRVPIIKYSKENKNRQLSSKIVLNI